MTKDDTQLLNLLLPPILLAFEEIIQIGRKSGQFQWHGVLRKIYLIMICFHNEVLSNTYIKPFIRKYMELLKSKFPLFCGFMRKYLQF